MYLVGLLSNKIFFSESLLFQYTFRFEEFLCVSGEDILSNLYVKDSQSQ